MAQFMLQQVVGGLGPCSSGWRWDDFRGERRDPRCRKASSAIFAMNLDGVKCFIYIYIYIYIYTCRNVSVNLSWPICPSGSKSNHFLFGKSECHHIFSLAGGQLKNGAVPQRPAEQLWSIACDLVKPCQLCKHNIYVYIQTYTCIYIYI